MSENQPPNKKMILTMSAVGLVAMSSLAWFLTRPQTTMVTDAYRYYPQNTAFYLEAAPGEKLAGRLMRGLDRLAEVSGEGQAYTSVTRVFEKDFKPEMGVGVWVSEKPESAEPTDKAPTLIVLSLKDGVTPEKLVTDLNTPMADYQVEKLENATLLTHKTHQQLPMLFHQNHLVTGNTPAILKQALAEWESKETLLDNPLYKENLGRLPAKRQGTLLGLSQEFQKLSPEKTTGQTDAFLKFQQQLSAATPVTVGSIVITNDQRVDIDSYTPVDMSKIEDESLRKDIVKLYQDSTKLDVISLLPKDTVAFGGMSSLGGYYDLYLQYFADAQTKQSIESMQTQLKMFGLDFRKNLVSLFDGLTGFSVVSHEGQPDVLVFLNGNTDTQTTMERVSTLASQMLRGEVSEKQIDSQHALNVFKAPHLPFNPAYGFIRNKTLVLGTQPGVEQMYEIDAKKAPSIQDNPLYKELSGNLPANTRGLFFIDVPRGGALLDKMAHKASSLSNHGGQPSVVKMLSGLEGIAGLNAIEGGSLFRFHVAVKLTPED